MGLRQTDGWLVRSSGDERDGKDLISFAGQPMGSVLWLRDLRYPSLARLRMTEGLNTPLRFCGVDSRASWTALEVTDGDDRVWRVLHNGVEIGELRWLSTFAGTFPHPTDGFLHGLNMLAGGRHPFAVEPMPLTRPHLTVVR